MKTQYINTGHYCFVLLMFLLNVSCKKQNDWLNQKSNKSAVVPETLADFQALLENSTIRNINYIPLGLIGADDFYIKDVNYASAPELIRNLYIWNKEVTGDADFFSLWSKYYEVIVYANIVLDGLQHIPTTGTDYNNIKGQALFYRGFSYYQLTQLFCKAYSNTATTDLGVPLRLDPDVNNILARASLEDTYKQILKDASEAALNLENSQPYFQRPVKAAAYALLAKTYLIMGNYNEAKSSADKCLKLRPDLMDFNEPGVIDMNTTFRFPPLAKSIPEILFYAQGVTGAISPSPSSSGFVSDELYQQYDDNDLRKTVFFIAVSSTDHKFRGTYTGQAQNFSGLANNEVYLIRAECNARRGDIQKVTEDLNLLLARRYKTGTIPEMSITTPAQALSMVLSERRKELTFVGNIRWEDLKRLNREPSFQKTLTRTIGGITYTLAPNDKRYVLPIPTKEIQLTGIQQNER